MDTTTLLPKILVVDDQPENRAALTRLLHRLSVEIHAVGTAGEALQLAQEHDFALGILDVVMPEMDGLQLAAQIKALKLNRPLPLLFLSGILDVASKMAQAYSLGAVDFLTKPYEPTVLLGKVKVFLELNRQELALTQSLLELHELNRHLTQEVEERKKAQEALLTSRRTLQALFDGISDAILILGASFEVTECNLGAVKMFGLSQDQMLGRPASDLLYGPKWPKKELAQKLEGLSHGALLEWQAQPPEGEPILVEIGSEQILVEGKAARLLSIRDISSRKLAEEKLRKLSQAVEQSPTSILITDTKGRIEYVNRKFCTLTGYRPEELEGKNPRILKSGQTAKNTYKELWANIKSGQPWSGELINRRKDGTLYHELTHITPIFDQHHQVTHYLGIKEDITQRKQAEEALITATKEASRANRAKSEFLANMSHEIRTPMNAILGFSEILADLVEDPQQAQFVRHIQTSGHALLTLINDILDLSKVEAGKIRLELSQFDPRPLIYEMRELFSQKAEEKGLAFLVKIDPQLPPAILADEVRLRQILLNLVGNAVKFTHQGHVRLAIKALHQGESNLDLVLMVEDTGIGIAQENLERIFGAFEQVEGQSSKYGGTGLGLAITKRLVEMMGGQILVKSRLGQGTTFVVKLSGIGFGQLNQKPAEEQPEDLTHLTFDPATLLVVDDLVVNRTLIKQYLSKYPFEILEAANGQEALDLAATYHPALILMDMKMPVLDGYQATARLKENLLLHKIPVVAVTAAVMKNEEERILGICDNMLSKPLSKISLLSKLALYLTHDIPNNEPAPKVIAPAPSNGDPVRWKRLSLALEREFGPRVKAVRETLTLNDAEALGLELSQAAKKEGYPPLEQWGATLYQQALGFEADLLKESLQDYERLTQEFHQALRSLAP